MPMDLSEIQERRREATFTFYGKAMHVEFWSERITREFREDMMRLNRMSLRVEQRREAIMARIQKVDAPPDTPEAELEDAAAYADFQVLLADDARVKQEIDTAILHVLASWEVTDKGKPVPISLEVLANISSEFEGAIVGAILNGSTPMGEANGRANTNDSPSTSKPRVLALTRKASSSRHRRA